MIVRFTEGASRPSKLKVGKLQIIGNRKKMESAKNYLFAPKVRNSPI